jgi:hypothetical protein
MSGLPNEALSDVPIEFWASRFETRKGKLVWKRRPREAFAVEGKWRDWNKRYGGKPAGAITHHGTRFVRMLDVPGLEGKTVSVPAEKIVIAVETGRWPHRFQSHTETISGPVRSAG